MKVIPTRPGTFLLLIGVQAHKIWANVDTNLSHQGCLDLPPLRTGHKQKASVFYFRSEGCFVLTLPTVPTLSPWDCVAIQPHKLDSVLMKLSWKMHYSNSRAFSLPDWNCFKSSPQKAFIRCLLLQTHSYWLTLLYKCGYSHSASYLRRFWVFSMSNIH